MTAIQECSFQMVEHSPYSLNSAPSDYYLVPKMKKELGSRHFHSDDEVKQPVEAYLEAQDATLYREGIQMLQNCWTKFVSLQGHYTEK